MKLHWGQRVQVTLHNDDRIFRAVYLGPASNAVDRAARRIFVVDDGESWKLLTESMISQVTPIHLSSGGGTHLGVST